MEPPPPERCAIVVALGVGDERQGSGAEVLVNGLTRHHVWGPATEVAEWYTVSPDLRDGLLQARDLPDLVSAEAPEVLRRGTADVGGASLPEGWSAGLRRRLGLRGSAGTVESVALRYPSTEDAAAADDSLGAEGAWTARLRRGPVLALVLFPEAATAPTPDDLVRGLRDRISAAEERVQPVHRFSVRRPSGLPDVDLYEFFWADASRFPAALRSFLAAFGGLFLSVAAAGRAALIGGGPVGAEPAVPADTGLKGAFRRPDRAALAVVEWLLAVVVPTVCVALLAVAGTLGVALAIDDARTWVRRAAVVGLAVVLAALALVLLRRYARDAHPSALPVGLAAAAAAAAAAAWRIGARDDLVLGLGDALALGVAYPFRLAWLGVVAAVAAGAVAALVLSRGRGSPRRECGLTALLALAVAPLGISLLLSLSTAAMGGALQPLAERAVFVRAPDSEAMPRRADERTPRCLGDHADWWPTGEDCPAPSADDDLTAWSWGARLHGQTVAPLLYVGGVGLVSAAALTALAAGRMRRTGAFVRGPAGQARRLSAVLASLERFGPTVFTAGLLAAAYAVAASWMPGWPLPWRDAVLGNSTGVASAAAIAGGLATLLIFTARRLGWSPGALVGGGRAKEFLRTVLDRAYDVSTFLREPPPRPRSRAPATGHRAPPRVPRERVLQRYRALVRHVAAGGASAAGRYERVIFVSHSQGSTLTATLLREPSPHLPADVRLVTFGSPLRQLYAARLPDQFGWVTDARTPPGAHLPAVAEWWNLASPGDFVGRTISITPPDPWPGEPTRRTDTNPKELLLPSGRHSVYWRDPALYDLLDELLTAPRL